AADLRLRIDLARVLEPQLALRRRQLGGIVGEHLPAAKRLVIAGLAIDHDPHVQLLAVLLAGGGRERGFERLEYDFFVHAFLVRDGVDHHQDFLVHCTVPPPGPSDASLALPISAKPTLTVCRSTSSATPSSSTANSL